MEERARRTAFVQVDQNAAITDAETDGRECREAACPLHQLQNPRQLAGLECVAEDAVVDQDRNAGELEIRAHVRARNDPAACE